MEKKSRVILIFQNFAYRRLAQEEAISRLNDFPELQHSNDYLLHVGSNLKRKNRASVLKIAKKMELEWQGKIVFAGEEPNAELLAEADRLGLSSRVVGINKPSNVVLEALYNRAFALLFPSRFEGFGWPVIEAQACGCPVAASDQTSLPEVVGEGGIVREVGDLDGFAKDLLTLSDPLIRHWWINKGFQNLSRFETKHVVDQYREVYRGLGES